MKRINIKPSLFYVVTILYLEILSKVIITDHTLNNGLVYLLIFTLPFILLITLLTKIFPRIINKINSFILMGIITVYFEVQLIFHRLFSVPFSFSTIGLADQALDFTNIIKDAILSNLLHFVLFLLPFILLIILNKKIDYNRYHKYSIISLIIMLTLSYGATFVTLIPNKSEMNSPYKLYFKIDDQASIIDTFGMLTYTKIDIKRQLFGYESEIVLDNEEEMVIPVEEGEIDYGFNELELDFEKATNNKNIQTLNTYFSNSNPSNKTKYTGMFKDKNLIFILAEGFNEIAVDEQRTPTLYKMVHTGFDFTNFYSPVFLSTTGGEFQATTGLIPTQEILGAWKSKMPTIYYGLGNAFSRIGYRAQSYHDWTYTYYSREKTMKTIGFTNYMGCGNGLEKRLHTDSELRNMKYPCQWLEYDSDMVNVTAPLYMGQEGNYVTYYVTVSGHSPYNYNDIIANHHFDTVKDLNYSSQVKYYLASQVELDKMLEALVKQLEENGELDDTVIALVGDHYPYTLSTEEMNEAASYTKDGVIEINRSNFILWNNAMEEPIVVDKVGSQIDVLPTLLNLFGIEYDSRLILGKDILSNSEGIAIFSNRSWVTDYGWYQASSRKFTLREGMELENQDEYINRINNKVNNYFSISKLIVDNDYYIYIIES
ncbi:MAG: LTA synthase family protein [Bacilli bacterium]|nr:LTA synthase family protein [Bacilli bacterium]